MPDSPSYFAGRAARRSGGRRARLAAGRCRRRRRRCVRTLARPRLPRARLPSRSAGGPAPAVGPAGGRARVGRLRCATATARRRRPAAYDQHAEASANWCGVPRDCSPTTVTAGRGAERCCDYLVEPGAAAPGRPDREPGWRRQLRAALVNLGAAALAPRATLDGPRRRSARPSNAAAPPATSDARRRARQPGDGRARLGGDRRGGRRPVRRGGADSAGRSTTVRAAGHPRQPRAAAPPMRRLRRGARAAHRAGGRVPVARRRRRRGARALAAQATMLADRGDVAEAIALHRGVRRLGAGSRATSAASPRPCSTSRSAHPARRRPIARRCDRRGRSGRPRARRSRTCWPASSSSRSHHARRAGPLARRGAGRPRSRADGPLGQASTRRRRWRSRPWARRDASSATWRALAPPTPRSWPWRSGSATDW